MVEHPLHCFAAVLDPHVDKVRVGAVGRFLNEQLAQCGRCGRVGLVGYDAAGSVALRDGGSLFLDECHMCSRLAGGERSRNARGACANDNHVEVKRLLDIGDGVGRYEKRRQPCALVAGDRRGLFGFGLGRAALRALCRRAAGECNCARRYGRRGARDSEKASARYILRDVFHG